MNDEQKYIFSVIIPIYNVEKFLEETIESVINQSIGFEKNIQMILVNDGSPDNSEEICLKYKKIYPDNIIYIKQENGGVSTARNNGVKLATGKYVTFLDSDDKWDKNAFKRVYKFFEKHYEEVDLVCGRMRFFEASTEYHPLDYKFENGTRVIDIFKEPNMIHLHITSSFIKTKIAQKNLFDKRLKYGEDAKYVEEVIVNRGKYGIVKEAKHYYRRRLDESSAIQNKNSKLTWYKDTPNLFYKYIYDLSIKKYNKVIRYVQNIVMYDYQWRIKEYKTEYLSEKEQREYFAISQKLLSEVDSDIILSQKNLSCNYKEYILKLKYGDKYKDHIDIKDAEYYVDDIDFYSLINQNVLEINIFKLKNNKLTIIGQVNSLLEKTDFNILIKIDGKTKKIDLFDVKKNVVIAFGQEIHRNQAFKEIIDISDDTIIEFYIEYSGKKIKLTPTFTLFAKLNSNFPTHYKQDGYSIECVKNRIIFSKQNKFKSFFQEIKLLGKLLIKGKTKGALYRVLYYIYKLFNHNKNIWIITDRTMVANDNGMHLFKYITKRNKKDDIYFAIDKKSKDYNKMKKIGKVLPYGTLKYKMYFLLSKAIISSQADAWVYNAFGKSEENYRDLFKFEFVFLQHGVTKDDISDWLNVYDKDFSILVTTAKREYDSIVKSVNYGYNENVVKLTGFPRYDNLVSDSKKQIAIMPTWRKNLSGKNNVLTGIREYNEQFKYSDYFTFYDKLINDKRLLDVMRKKGYNGVFVVHPSHMNNYVDFNGNDVFKVVEGFADYQKIFKESNLLISDFSSVPFDFAYMHKPVIYTQFDRDVFFSNHLYDEGYFSYEEDGFGPVTYNYEDSINEIINLINNECKIEKKYDDRINKFYKYNDRNNCKRVYEEIIKKLK